MPLTERVKFKTVLQKGNRVQLPKLVRWEYKLNRLSLEGHGNGCKHLRGLGNLLREDGPERTHNHAETDAETAARQNP